MSTKPANHAHRHDHCKHDHLKYCAHCDKPHCLDCGQEWNREKSNWWYTAPTIQPYTPYTTSGYAQVVDGIANPDQSLPSVTCSTITTTAGNGCTHN